MSYSYSKFLLPLRESDKLIRIYDDSGVSKYTINPFSVLRVFVSNSNLNIVLTGNKSIVIDFNDGVKDSLRKLQEYIDELKSKSPSLISDEVEKYVSGVVGDTVDYSKVYNDLKSGITQSNFNTDDINSNILNFISSIGSDVKSISNRKIVGIRLNPISDFEKSNIYISPFEYTFSEKSFGFIEVYINGILLDITSNNIGFFSKDVNQDMNTFISVGDKFFINLYKLGYDIETSDEFIIKYMTE